MLFIPLIIGAVAGAVLARGGDVTGALKTVATKIGEAAYTAYEGFTKATEAKPEDKK
jgi:hypothetical protein